MKKLILVIGFIVVAGAAAYVGYQGSMNDDATNSKKPADPRITAAWDMMIGTWSSEDDRNFIREYKNDGTLTDSYASATGEAKTDADWSLFTSDNADEVQFQLNNKDVYVKQVEKSGAVTYFRIDSVTPTELGLINMTKGGGLRFGKMTTGREMQDGQEDDIVASFRCDDNSSFIATFTAAMDKVTISSEGEDNVFNHVASTSGKKYENDMWTFLFKGETATVTFRKDGKTAICKPPFDPENAPVNFGD